jgi:hypothetical protein
MITITGNEWLPRKYDKNGFQETFEICSLRELKVDRS